MGEVVFKLPDLGEGLEDGTVTSWLVSEGDVVTLNQPLCTVETAKAEVEMPSPYAGRIVTCHGEEGETLPVGSPLVTIDASSVGDAAGFNDALARAGGEPEGESVTGNPPSSSTPVPTTPAAPAPDDSSPPAKASPKRQQVLVGYGAVEESAAGRRRRRRPAHSSLPSAPAAAGSAALDTVAAQRGDAGLGLTSGAAPSTASASAVPTAPTAPTAPTGTPQPARAGAALASPPVRLLARRLRLDLGTISGTGRAGLIQRCDVEAAATAARDSAAPATQATVAGGPASYGTPLAGRPAPAPLLAGGPRPGDIIPVKGVRAVIAKHMSLSRTEIPDATCSRWVDMSAVLNLRARLKHSVPSAKLTPFALLSWLVVDALRREPSLNATYDPCGGEGAVIRLHSHVHLGIAIDTPRGLVVANVRDAEQRSLGNLAAEIHRMATTGRAGKLAPDDMMGSTFTMSNYGAFGLDDGSSIINYPEVAILGVGSLRKRPWVDPDTEELVVRPTACLTLSFDHRVADGGHAGRFMTRMADLIASPERLLLEG